MWEIFSKGTRPYEIFSNLEVAKAVPKGLRETVPEDCNPSIGDLMQKCWNRLPSERPSFKSIVSTLDQLVQKERKEEMTQSQLVEINLIQEVEEENNPYHNTV